MRYLIPILFLALALFAPVPADAAATQVVYPNGTAVVSVPASQYLNVATFGGSSAKVYKLVGYPNIPALYTLETNGTVSNQETVFGAYTAATTIKIEAGTDPVYYSVGALAASVPILRGQPRIVYTQLAPITYTTTQTLLATDLMTGIITATHTAGGTVAYTLPTGTLTDTATGLQIGQAFEWSLINLSAAAADTITLTAGSGHTIVGTAVVASAHSTTGGLYGNAARWLTRKTAANTFVTYRIH